MTNSKHYTKPSSKSAVSYGEHPWTFRIVGLNLVIFLLIEISLGLDSSSPLLMLGMFEPQSVISGQWWRILTSTLLHADFMHLMFNMIAMLIFGSMLEKIAGAKLYVFVYVAGGVLANLLVLAVLIALSKPYLSIGASGSVMAVIGASLSCALYIYYKTRLQYWRMFFSRMLILLSIQLLIDIFLPNNAMLVHLAGGISGIALGWLVVWIKVAGLQKHQN